jgi:hypothetical protein
LGSGWHVRRRLKITTMKNEEAEEENKRAATTPDYEARLYG